MPGEWEKGYGLDLHDASDTSKDSDNDGYTNIVEYLNGTNPTEYVDYTKPENNVNTLKERVRSFMMNYKKYMCSVYIV